MNIKQAHIVIDLGFGDSGKGFLVDHLAGLHPERTLALRFSGGHQVGHTVRRDNIHHTFSNFGAASFHDVPTYYLPNTTLFPPALLEEAARLHPLKPTTWLHPLVMVTTPFDVALNRARQTVLQHGSCGVGFGATIVRHQAGITTFAKDLQYPFVLREKLKAVRTYYQHLVQGTPWEQAYQDEIADCSLTNFLKNCEDASNLVDVKMPKDLPSQRDHFVFEGSQGVLLDQEHGLFPHVTRSHTTSKNALAFLKATGIKDVNIHYVTRCYQTRHGNGPMAKTEPVTLINDEDEANQTNHWQGELRTSALDADLLRYALDSDATTHEGFNVGSHLMVTCLDQLPNFDIEKLLSDLKTSFKTVHVRKGAASDWKPERFTRS